MKKLAALCALVLAFAPLARAQDEPSGVLKKDLALFLDWFPGRYDNSLQVFWAPEVGVPEDDRHGRIHSIFRPVDLPAFGDHVFYVEQYQDGDPAKVYRQRIYSFMADGGEDAIRLKIYTPKDTDRLKGAYRNVGVLKRLSPRNTTTREGCDVFWKRQSNQFVGYMKEGACRFMSQRMGKEIIISDDLILTESEIWISDRAETVNGEYVFGNKAGVHHKLRKIRPFQCWVSRLRGATHGDSGEGKNGWTFDNKLWLHDQGGELRMAGGDDFDSDARFILRRMEWPSGTNRSSLVLYVYEGEGDRATSYSWTEYDSERVGLNLRWIQASCTYAPERVFEDGR
jgi:hypothetical protein